LKIIRSAFDVIFRNSLLRARLVRSPFYTWENFLLVTALIVSTTAVFIRFAAWRANWNALLYLPGMDTFPEKIREGMQGRPGSWALLGSWSQLFFLIFMLLGLIRRAVFIPLQFRRRKGQLLTDELRMLPITNAQLIFAVMDWGILKPLFVLLVCLALYVIPPSDLKILEIIGIAKTTDAGDAGLILLMALASIMGYRWDQLRRYRWEFIRTRLFWAGFLWLALLAFSSFYYFRRDPDPVSALFPLVMFLTLYLIVAVIPVPENLAERMIDSDKAE